VSLAGARVEGEMPVHVAGRITAQHVKAHFAGVVEGELVRYELPNIAALNFVREQMLGGG
jgi:hypothetical protein